MSRVRLSMSAVCTRPLDVKLQAAEPWMQKRRNLRRICQHMSFHVPRPCSSGLCLGSRLLQPLPRPRTGYRAKPL